MKSKDPAGRSEPSRSFPFYLDGKAYEINALMTFRRCRLTARATQGDFTITCEDSNFTGALKRLQQKIKGDSNPDEYND